MTRFHDLITLEIPTWVILPFEAPLPDKSSPLYEELFRLRYDSEMRKFCDVKRYMAMWRQCQTRYPSLWAKVELLVLASPTTWHVESAFSFAVNLLTKSRNRLNLTKSGDLRIRLWKEEIDMHDVVAFYND